MKTTDILVRRRIGEGGLLESRCVENIHRSFVASQQNILFSPKNEQEDGYIPLHSSMPLCSPYDMPIRTHFISDRERDNLGKAFVGGGFVPPAPVQAPKAPPSIPGKAPKAPSTAMPTAPTTSPTTPEPPKVATQEPPKVAMPKPPKITAAQPQKTPTEGRYAGQTKKELAEATSTGISTGRRIGGALLGSGAEVLGEAASAVQQSAQKKLGQMAESGAKQTQAAKQSESSQLGKLDAIRKLKGEIARQQQVSSASSAKQQSSNTLDAGKRAATSLLGKTTPTSTSGVPLLGVTPKTTTPTSSFQQKMLAPPAPKAIYKQPVDRSKPASPIFQQKAGTPTTTSSPKLSPEVLKQLHRSIPDEDDFCKMDDQVLEEGVQGNMRPTTYGTNPSNEMDGWITIVPGRGGKGKSAIKSKENKEEEEDVMSMLGKSLLYSLNYKEALEPFEDSPYYADALDCASKLKRLKAEQQKYIRGGTFSLFEATTTEDIKRIQDDTSKRNKIREKLEECDAQFVELEAKLYEWKAKQERAKHISKSIWSPTLNKGAKTGKQRAIEKFKERMGGTEEVTNKSLEKGLRFNSATEVLKPFQGTPFYARAMEIVAAYKDEEIKLESLDRGCCEMPNFGWNDMGLNFNCVTTTGQKKNDEERDKIRKNMRKIEKQYTDLEVELLRWGASNLRKEDTTQKGFNIQVMSMGKSLYGQTSDILKPFQGTPFYARALEILAEFKEARAKRDQLISTNEIKCFGTYNAMGLNFNDKPTDSDKYQKELDKYQKLSDAAQVKFAELESDFLRWGASNLRKDDKTQKGFSIEVVSKGSLADKIFPKKETVSKPVKPGTEVEEMMHKWKHEHPLSSTGEPPQSKEQAVAIGMSMQREGSKGKKSKKVKKGFRIEVTK